MDSEYVSAEMPPRVKELRAESRTLKRDLAKLNDAGKNRPFTSDEQQRWDRLTGRLEKIGSELDNLPTRVAFSAGQTGSLWNDDRSYGSSATASPEYRQAFDSYLRHGKANMDPSDRETLHAEQRAQSVGTGSEGGFSVPDELMAEVEIAMQSYNGILAGPVRRIRTATGADLPIPTTNDVSNGGILLAENTAASPVDIVFDQVVLGAYKFSSEVVLLSNELMQDTSINIGSFIAEILGERLGRAIAPYMVNGDGVAEPEGLDSAASFVTAAAAASITRQDVLDLIHSCDPSYRNKESFRILFNDSTFAALKALTFSSSDDRPLWSPSMREGAPSLVEGYPYIIDQNISSIGGGNRSMFCGDMSKLVIREAGPVRIVRLDERWGEYDQVGFIAFARLDSKLLDAGTNPFSYLRHVTS